MLTECEFNGKNTEMKSHLLEGGKLEDVVIAINKRTAAKLESVGEGIMVLRSD